MASLELLLIRSMASLLSSNPPSLPHGATAATIWFVAILWLLFVELLALVGALKQIERKTLLTCLVELCNSPSTLPVRSTGC